LIIGALCVLLGLTVGFGAMFSGYDEIAKIMLALVPIGFISGFAGIVTTLMFPSES
jgi:hypothetical protein